MVQSLSKFGQAYAYTKIRKSEEIEDIFRIKDNEKTWLILTVFCLKGSPNVYRDSGCANYTMPLKNKISRLRLSLERILGRKPEEKLMWASTDAAMQVSLF